MRKNNMKTPEEKEKIIKRYLNGETIAELVRKYQIGHKFIYEWLKKYEENGIDVYVMPLGDEARDLAMQIITMLRANGFTCDMDYAGRGLKGQFKSSDRFGAHLSIIIGEDEVKGEYVNIRCNHSKEQSKVKLEDILSYIENHYEGDHEHE